MILHLTRFGRRMNVLAPKQRRPTPDDERYTDLTAGNNSINYVGYLAIGYGSKFWDWWEG